MCETMNLLYPEHRELYKRKYGSGTQEEDAGGSSSSSPPVEAFDVSEAELSLLCGEEVSEQAEQSLAESILPKEADLRIEWVEVAMKQYVTKEECNEVMGMLSMVLPDGKRVWNVERLCQYINLRQWFLDTGEQTIALLARVWLGRRSSTAFQERVFSTRSFVMSPLRTRTDNERAHRQLILHHNANEIERLKESSRNVW
ncbi:hypothetical protein JG688_00008204 [Phytophthora aleatoria]|uniref:HAT C-terminal dimerisation domain-containing protein n=1 Tax=Phytophthora aleatoria TaxID=2496075 RepID=A0A8J5IIW6_9STRA|nr:hypothetical protein JG688_00008204 [Phytophthora aleatoria]